MFNVEWSTSVSTTECFCGCREARNTSNKYFLVSLLTDDPTKFHNFSDLTNIVVSKNKVQS